MEKEIENLQRYLQDVANFTLPKFKELPSVDLYMEQVLTYINDCLDSLNPEGEKMLTSFMVNNYVKAKMIAEPKKKKYSKEQIGYLMAICLFKASLSMGDMSLLLELDDGISSSKERIYRFWSSMENNILDDSAEKAARHVDYVARRYAADKKAKKAGADESARNSLALLALRLAMQAQANKLLSDYIISVLRRSMHGEAIAKEANKPGKHEIKHEIRQGEHEAERVAAIKQKESKLANEKKKEAAAKKSNAKQASAKKGAK